MCENLRLHQTEAGRRREASSAAAGVTDVARTIGLSTAPLFVGLMTSLQIFCRASALSKCRCRISSGFGINRVGEGSPKMMIEAVFVFSVC